jgi:hypothetical protein
MKIYLAGSCVSKTRMDLWNKMILNRLLSFYELHYGLFNIPYAFELIKESKNKNISGRKQYNVNGSEREYTK